MAGAVAITLAFFLVLPLMQTLSKPPKQDMVVRSVDTGKLEAPDPPPEPEPEEEEPEPEKEPPKLEQNNAPLDLSQLEVALNPGFGDGWAAGDFGVSLNTFASENKDVDALFSIADLDQKPRVLYQPGPTMNAQMRKNAPGKVYVIFIVDKQGRVASPRVQKSTNPVFEKAAISTIKRWKFEPGKRNGKAVRFRMRVPFVFPKG
ncbi:energy transducer TonB [Anaerohalosphaera lusitana]|nr:energy transducer TonB [Anaerohalosphaera lusitana]